MNKTFERELPESYVLDKTIDAGSKKLGILLNLLAFFIAVVIMTVGIALFVAFNESIEFEVDEKVVVASFGVCIGLIVYMVLHELVHGLIYKIETHEKLTFGIKLTCAYCGVPNIYVYRKSAICAAIAPFVVFNIIFIVPLFFVNNFSIFFALLLLFASHFGGCIGDIYVVGLLLFKYKDNNTLIRDTGPKQLFYVYKEN